MGVLISHVPLVLFLCKVTARTKYDWKVSFHKESAVHFTSRQEDETRRARGTRWSFDRDFCTQGPSTLRA